MYGEADTMKTRIGEQSLLNSLLCQFLPNCLLTICLLQLSWTAVRESLTKTLQISAGRSANHSLVSVSIHTYNPPLSLSLSL